MTVPKDSMPALLNRISTCSKALRVAWTIASTLEAELTSVLAQMARPPSLLIDSATAAADSPLISASITPAPSLANKRAVTSPKPEPPPVIIATLSFNRMLYPQLQQGQRPTPCSSSQGCGTGSLSGITSAFLLPHLEQTHSSGGRVPARTNPWNLCPHSGHSNVKTGITFLQL